MRACADAPSPAHRELIADALSSKWEGVQSVAIQVLGTWCDDDARRMLRETIERLAERRYGWALRGVAAKAMARCITADDAEWALDWMFSRTNASSQQEFLPVVCALPVEAVRARFTADARSPIMRNRQATMKAIGRMPFPDREELLTGFLDDPEEDIRLAASYLLGQRSSPFKE